MKRILTMFATLAALATHAAAQDFPLTIEHKFGETVIEERPERVASVDLTGADDLLALGVQPVTIVDWFGNYPQGLWSWAAPLLDGEPEILRGQLNFEQVARADPDVIIALSSGITAAEYNRLSSIAPVVAAPEGVGAFALPWDRRALLAGRAVGRLEEARAQISALEQRFRAIRDEHPDWQGATVTVPFVTEDRFGVYTRFSPRVELLERLGFETPDRLDELIEGQPTAIDLSLERLGLVDADLVLWIAYGDFAVVRDLDLRQALDANEQGREIFVGKELWGAFAYSSLLSIPVILDRLVPQIEAAIDGDPATPIPATNN